MNNEKCPKILWPWLILLLHVHITFCHNLNKRNLGQKETVFAVWSPLPPWGQRLFRVALRISNFLRFQSLKKKIIMNILWNFRCTKFKWVFIKSLATMCPLFYVWSCGIAKKNRKFPDTQSCFLSSHNKKYEAKVFLESYLYSN